MEKFVIKRIYQPESVQSIFTRLGRRALLIIDSKHYVLSEAYPIDTKHEVALFKSDDQANITSFDQLWVRVLVTFDQALKELGQIVRVGGWRPLNESKDNS